MPQSPSSLHLGSQSLTVLLEPVSNLLVIIFWVCLAITVILYEFAVHPPQFHKRNQREGESIQAYTVEIKRLSEHCNFGPHLDQSLRDRLVCGLRGTTIQKRLLQEADLTFQIAYDKAVALEMTSRDAAELHGNASSAQLGQEIKSILAMARKPQAKGKFSACQSCGKTNHSRENCYFREAECKACHKKGHIQSVCRSKATQPKVLFKAKPKKVHQLEEGTDFFSIDLQVHQSAVTTNKI
ncbi:hypothetical protein RRG08_017848 [Elysia crispata]|uniref:CCHC-type domain-containing protein n=1 Tax=Elysia crispata TaxID=231223 RepID=A0AAE1CJW6_9GAST|nr:hypothetical protein RRG08_017848 [Elysia crispata]